jgi:hypothetical protein
VLEHLRELRLNFFILLRGQVKLLKSRCCDGHRWELRLNFELLVLLEHDSRELQLNLKLDVGPNIACIAVGHCQLHLTGTTIVETSV